MSSYWIYGITLFCKIDELEDDQLKAVKGRLDEVMFSKDAFCEEILDIDDYTSRKVSFLYKRDSLISEEQGKYLLSLGVIKHVKVVDALNDLEDYYN